MDIKETDGDKIAGAGCAIAFAVLAAAYAVITILNAIINFVIFMLPIVGIAGAVYALWWFNKETGRITTFFARFMDDLNDKFISRASFNIDTFITIKEKERLLPPVREEVLEKILSSQIADLEEKMTIKVDEIKADNERNMERQREETETFVISNVNRARAQWEEEQKQANKVDLLDAILGRKPPKEGYSKSPVLEERSKKEDTKRKKEELERAQWEFEITRRQFLNEQERLEWQKTLEAQLAKFKEEVHVKFEYLNKSYQDLRQFVEAKFLDVYSKLSNAVIETKALIESYKTGFDDKLGKLTVQIGKEIVRMDGQYMKALSALERYTVEVDRYKKASELLAEKMYLQDQKVEINLKTADSLYKKVLDEHNFFEKKAEQAIYQIELVDRDFAQKVREKKFELDVAGKDIHFALKDLGAERLGVEMFREQSQIRLDNAKEDLRQREQWLARDIREYERDKKKDKETAEQAQVIYTRQLQIERLQQRIATMEEEDKITNRLAQLAVKEARQEARSVKHEFFN